MTKLIDAFRNFANVPKEAFKFARIYFVSSRAGRKDQRHVRKTQAFASATTLRWKKCVIFCVSLLTVSMPRDSVTGLNVCQSRLNYRSVKLRLLVRRIKLNEWKGVGFLLRKRLHVLQTRSLFLCVLGWP